MEKKLSTQHSTLCAETPRYWEAVTIGWRILWQGVGTVLLTLFLANVAVLGLLPELARTGPSIWAFAFPLLAVATLSLFVLMPLLVRALLTQPFGSFRLQLVRKTEPAVPDKTDIPRMTDEEREGGVIMTYRTMGALVFASTLLAAPIATSAIGTETHESELHLVSGTLMKLDLSRGKGLLTTDLGRPIYFEVPKAYLFENVTVGARISLRLDEYGRALKVMDTSIPDVILSPDATGSVRPIAASLQDPMSDTQ